MNIFSKKAFKKAVEDWKSGNTTTQVTNNHWTLSGEYRRLQEIKNQQRIKAVMKANGWKEDEFIIK